MEITIRNDVIGEIRGNKDAAIKIIKNYSTKPWYLVKVIKDNKIIYLQETASSQPKISVEDNHFVLEAQDCMNQKEIEAAVIIQASVRIDKFINQANLNQKS